MQETSYYDGEEMKRLLEFFMAPTEKSVEAAMDQRLGELQEEGHTLVTRKKIGRNDPCPCESGKKFKRCCLK